LLHCDIFARQTNRQSAMTACPKIFGYPISDLSQDEVVLRALRTKPAGAGVSMVATMNVDHVVNLQKNPRFRAAYDFASTVVADGTPVFLIARIKGSHVQRITGSDLAVAIDEKLTPGIHRPFYVVSQTAVGEKLVEDLVARGFSRADVAFFCPPMGFQDNAQQSAEITRAVRDLRATHLFMGVGAPKSEIWIYEHRHDLGDLNAFCFGAGLDFLAGTQTRAPKLVSHIGFEWLWRLLSQPKRLGRRYLINSWTFFPAAP
jgi:N-acetylglucosaminyldiphosphoundecaprenol N-acetyl-beta-D-mannosaminyltransferase